MTRPKGNAMSHPKTLARLAVAPLVVLALSAPPAVAMGDTPYTDAERAANDRYQAGAGADDTLLKNSRAIAEAYRADGANQSSAQQDRRSENAADPFSGTLPRVWPAYPRAIPPIGNPVSVPTTVADDGGDDWVIPVLAIGGTLLLGAGIATGRNRGGRVRPA
jgi:hypothetical protein